MPDVPAENTAPSIGVTQGRPAILATRWLVSSSHYLASEWARAVTGATIFADNGFNIVGVAE